MMPGGRIFTLDEALQLLPVIRRLIEEIQEQRRALDQRTI
jgi:hypothetical protein